MTSLDDLDGAFRSLNDTLQTRYSPFLPEAIGGRWLGTMGGSASIARDAEAWAALLDPPDHGMEAVSALDGASRALAASTDKGDAAILSALDLADASLARLRGLLDEASK